ncbi:reverse transcriptase domain-containing protein, partial [Enterobacter cloacae complex sp. 2DZ2F20B]|uniref:reverse transcriptase domain-containing protein n=1 Tax=Enterobacter cloacae complex sp. 2DZ2F20B TaxID=2511993 RepID=UPI0013EC7987
MDFKKAFDSVPHDWILKVLGIYKVDEDLVKFLENGMSKWKTRIHLKPNILTSTIQLKKGVFQGDSTSVILFWTAINPLSFALRATNVGPKLRHGATLLSHVLYMDDLKLY